MKCAPVPPCNTGGFLYVEQDMPEQLTGAEALIRSLELEGVEVVFGMPGGAILMAYDPLLDSPIRHVLARHEQGAGHMASGYAHATGRVGVALVTSGPAATNLLTALQERLDSYEHGSANWHPDSVRRVLGFAPPRVNRAAAQRCNAADLTADQQEARQ